ncbi:hypothetical protein BSKO_06755 [Bryopsis sp. KO-2023]|nr:hypothetical protein BSKO_06755 [Bryopsis sp. KO-2023]
MYWCLTMDSYRSTSRASGADIPILAFLMTKAQMDNADLNSLSLDYIEGSECGKANCTKVVKIPKNGDVWPFFWVLVNADHAKPEFEQTKEEDVDVGVSINAIGCLSPGKLLEKKKSGATGMVIVVPVVVLFIIAAGFVSFLVMKRNHRRSVMPTSTKDNFHADKKSPLALASRPSKKSSLHNRSSTPPTTLSITVVAGDVDAIETLEMLFAAKEAPDLLVNGPIRPPSFEPPPTQNLFNEDHVCEQRPCAANTSGITKTCSEVRLISVRKCQ